MATTTEWAVRNKMTRVISPAADELDAKNSARLKNALAPRREPSRYEIVSRTVSSWEAR